MSTVLNPFTLQMEELKYAKIMDYDDSDLDAIKYLISLEKPSVRRTQLVEHVHRDYQRRGKNVTRVQVLDTIIYAISYSKKLLSNRYEIKIFNSEEDYTRFSELYESIMIAIKVIFEGNRQATLAINRKEKTIQTKEDK